MDTVDNAGRAAAEPVGRVRAFKNIPYCARCTYELSVAHSQEILATPGRLLKVSAPAPHSAVSRQCQVAELLQVVHGPRRAVAADAGARRAAVRHEHLSK